MLTCVDLFSGMGGNTLGAEQAGCLVKLAANHWPAAVTAHWKNHPAVEHRCQDLQQADFSRWPDFDVMLASPACQGHSIARGKERAIRHDATRSTAWAVVACAEAKRPKFLMVENVSEFTRWQLYPQWRACLEQLGYVVHENVIDAADLGVPQNRRRLILTAVHSSVGCRPLVLPKGNHPHVAASTVLDLTADNWSAVYKPGRAKATIARIESGRATLGARFLAPYWGSGSGKTGRSLDRPIGTLTTKDRYSLVDGDRMRMLTAGECLAFQGFPKDYWLPTSHATAIKLIGNSAPPQFAKLVCEQMRAYLSN